MKKLLILCFLGFLFTLYMNFSFAINESDDLKKIVTKEKLEMESENLFLDLEKYIASLSNIEKMEKLNVFQRKINRSLKTKLSENNEYKLLYLRELIENKITLINRGELIKNRVMENKFIHQIDKFSSQKKQNLLLKINKILENNNNLNEASLQRLRLFKGILEDKIGEQKKQIFATESDLIDPYEIWWKVICTELTRQGYINPDIWIWDEIYAEKHITKTTLAVYHFWAKPIVELMQKSPFITKVIAPYWIAWAQHMAYNTGMVEKDSWLWYHIFHTLLPIHNKLSSLFVSNGAEVKNQGEVKSKPNPTLKELIQVSILYIILFLFTIMPLFVTKVAVNFFTVVLRKILKLSLFTYKENIVEVN